MGDTLMKDEVYSPKSIDCKGQLEVFMEKIQRRFQACTVLDLETIYLYADSYFQREAAQLEDVVHVLKSKVHMLYALALSRLGLFPEAIKRISTALDLQSTDSDILWSKAQILEEAGHFQDAFLCFHRLRKLHPEKPGVAESLVRTAKLALMTPKDKTNAKGSSHHEVLAVSASATRREIRRAYLSQATKWHPDRCQEKDKKLAEEMFRKSKEAYEGLLLGSDQNSV